MGKMNFFTIVGLPGCGKGTNGNLLSKKYKIHNICCGDLLRKKNLVDGAKLVEDNVILDLLNEEIKVLNKKIMEEEENEDDTGEMFLLIDGFPRKPSQIYCPGFELEFAIFLEISIDEAQKRIMNRHQGRSDDKLSIISKRIIKYNEMTKPMIDEIEKKNKLIKIQAKKPVNEVFSQVELEMDKFLKRTKGISLSSLIRKSK